MALIEKGSLFFSFPEEIPRLTCPQVFFFFLSGYITGEKIAFCYIQYPAPFSSWPVCIAEFWHSGWKPVMEVTLCLAHPRDPQAFSSRQAARVVSLPFQISERKNSFQADSPLGKGNRHFLYDLFSFIFKFIFTDSINAASLELIFNCEWHTKKSPLPFYC